MAPDGGTQLPEKMTLPEKSCPRFDRRGVASMK